MAAFTWWTLTHIRSHTEIAELKKQNITARVAEAKLHILDLGLIDTSDIRFFITHNYPELTISFQSIKIDKPIYTIKPSQVSLAEHDLYINRKIKQYVGEGIVMMILLFWGMLVIYRTFSKNIKLNRQQTNFLLSITHELKTPIASVKLYIETMLKRDLDKEKTNTILRNSLLDMKRLQTLVENLLLSAQIESKKYDLVLIETDLSSLLIQILNKYAAPRGIENRLIINIKNDIYIDCDVLAIEMLLTNLLDNAIKYSPANSPIEFILSQEENQTFLQITDQGDGISDDEKKTIFQKFFRSGDENTRKSKGTGLGLFIIKNIIQLHKAQIEVLDNKPKGTIFKITFDNI